MAAAQATAPIVGVLAIQGDFAAHEARLAAAGVTPRQVRRPRQLEGLSGLVLPGGESTAMLRLLELQGLAGPLRELLARDRPDLPVLATCAGLILLAREVVDPVQPGFGELDVKVARNGYGRQIHSGTFPLHGPDVPAGATGVFIRAPRILAVGSDVEVLAYRDEDPVLVRRGAVLGACFHPELEEDHFVMGRFLAQVRRAATTFSRLHRALPA